MNIDKNSWHYKIWAWSHHSSQVPDQTSLCAYVQRTALTIIGSPVYAAMGLGYYLMIAPFCQLLFMLHGRVAKNWSDVANSESSPYPPLNVAGWLIYPAQIVTPAYAASLLYQIYPKIVVPASPDHTIELLAFILVSVLIMTLAFLSVVLAQPPEYFKLEARGVTDGSLTDKPTGVFAILREYIKAKKDRFCPTVTFVAPSKDTNEGY